jgi:hypothetical protein
MPDVKDLNFIETLHNATDDTIHMWFAAVKKLSKILVLRRPGAPQGIGLQGEYCPLQSVEPSKSGIRMFHKIALGARHDPNEVSHALP